MFVIWSKMILLWIMYLKWCWLESTYRVICNLNRKLSVPKVECDCSKSSFLCLLATTATTQQYHDKVDSYVINRKEIYLVFASTPALTAIFNQFPSLGSNRQTIAMWSSQSNKYLVEALILSCFLQILCLIFFHLLSMTCSQMALFNLLISMNR